MRNDLKPLRSEADHRAAMADIERLWGASPDTSDGDRLEILATLVAAYEDVHHAIELPDPVDAILFRMEQEGLSRRDLEPFIGPRGRVAEVLNRRRPLTLSMIRRLHEGLGIPAEVLIRQSVAA